MLMKLICHYLAESTLILYTATWSSCSVPHQFKHIAVYCKLEQLDSSQSCAVFILLFHILYC